jgi:hypothetical protein
MNLKEHEAAERARKLLAESIRFRTTITDTIKQEVCRSLSGGANLDYVHIRNKEPKLPYRMHTLRTTNLNKLLSSDDW